MYGGGRVNVIRRVIRGRHDRVRRSDVLPGAEDDGDALLLALKTEEGTTSQRMYEASRS